MVNLYTKEETYYFTDKNEEENTLKVLEISREYALKNDIKSIIVASTRGRVASKLLDFFDPTTFNLIVVTHSCWFRPNIKQEFDSKVLSSLNKKGVKVVTAAHALGGVCRAVGRRFGGIPLTVLIADVLRLFCEGVKVAVEITLMATDAGYVNPGEEVISIGGTGRGADTALVITAAPSEMFFDLKIKKVLAKPVF
ncbi:MAG: hypothetical protein DRJ47_00295 [Thermoprotei archaeon]|nr:MAG: hypothetical protein DRJ47_00295 [Thermoprotei archaeon]